MHLRDGELHRDLLPELHRDSLQELHKDLLPELHRNLLPELRKDLLRVLHRGLLPELQVLHKDLLPGLPELQPAVYRKRCRTWNRRAAAYRIYYRTCFSSFLLIAAFTAYLSQ